MNGSAASSPGRKLKLAFVLLACVLLLVGITVIFPRVVPARAAGATLTVSPRSGVYSTRFITVTGSSYAPNETANVYWNYSGPGTRTLKKAVSTDATGAFTTKFQIPLAATATYTIAGIGQTSQLVATGTFLLLPILQVSPLVGIAGTSLTISGKAFGAGEIVKLYWNYTGPGTGTLLTTATGNSTGSFTVGATVPASAVTGPIPIAGVGQTSNTTASFNFTIYAPTLALAPLQGSAGTALTLSAYGFQSSENVNIYWNNATTPLLTGTTNTFGYLAPVVITVPAGSAPGSKQVEVIGQTSNITAINTFTVVTPAASLSLTTGPVAAVVNVSGQGYQPGEHVNVLWNYTGPGTGTTMATATAGFAGTVTASFPVPLSTNGTYTVADVGSASNIVTQNSFSVGNGLAASPSTIPPGTSTTVVGSGFQPGESVRVYWGSTSGAVLATTTADAHGNISQAVIIPTNAAHGPSNLVAVGQSSGQSFTTAVTVDVGWGDFGFDTAHDRQNIYENSVNTSSVAGLKVRWTATTPVHTQSSPVYANGTVYFTTSDGRLNAYDATSGSLKWQFNSNTGFPNPSAPLVDPVNNIVFFGTVGQTDPGIPSPTYALDATSGTLKWSLIIPWDEYGFPSLAFNTIYVGVSVEAGPGSLLALDEASGHVDWQYATTGGVWGAVATDVSTGTVFTGVGNPSDKVVELNATSGALVWQFNVPNSGGDDDVGAGIVVANGLVYANSKNGNMYAIHEGNGTMAWSTPVGIPNSGNVSTPALANGNVYVGSLDTNLYALNATTGAVLWKVPTGNGIFSSPSVANGVVYIASTDQKIYAVNATTGAVLWHFTTSGRVTSSPILVNSWLYCGSTAGKLYAFHL